jgi:cysteine synthase A
MADIKTNLLGLIGDTPIMELAQLEKIHGLAARILGKLECCNPAGSVKDRIAKSMIEDAEEKGLLKPGDTIIEPTSGNTGVGLAAVAAYKGYQLVLVMPDSTSLGHRTILLAYGAELILTDGAQGIKAAIAKAEELAGKTPRSFIPGQFINSANPAVHFATTGPEIWRQTDGKVDIFVAGVGTGGTITGTGEFLKSRNPRIKIVAVEPDGSPFLSEGRSGHHRIQGIGAGFAPAVLNTGIYDEVIRVKDADAFATGREIARREGILVGISSGAAVWAAIEVAKRQESHGKNILALLPDMGDRYISTPLFGGNEPTLSNPPPQSPPPRG